MFLKEAGEIAKGLGFTWIAVDSAVDNGDNAIIAYENEPIRNNRFWMPGVFGTNTKYIGVYDGAVVWTKTKREIA